MDTELISDVHTERQEQLISMAQFTPPQLTASQSRQLELFQHMAQYSELMLAVTGPEKIGKTFLARALVASREAPDHTIFITAEFSSSVLSVFSDITRSLDLHEASDETMAARSVADYAMSLDEGTILVVVDQADQLDTEVLLRLLELSQMVPDIVHVALFGTESLESELSSLAGAENIHFSPVEPISDEEAELLLLGAFPEEDWQAEQVDLLVSLSEGITGKLLDYAQAMLEGNLRLEAELEQAAKATVRFPVTHIAAILLIGSALVVSYLYQGHEPEPIALPENLAAQFPLSESGETGKVEKSVALLTENPLSEPVNAETSEVRTEVSEPEEVDFNFIEPVPVVAASPQQAVPDNKQIKEQPARGSEGKQAERNSAGSGNKVSVSGSEYSGDEKAIMSLSSTDFVVQLFGSFSIESAGAFIQKHDAAISGLLSYQTVHNGKPWFVVVSAPYSSRTEGATAIEKMPAEVRRQKPWIRSVASVKAAVRN